MTAQTETLPPDIPDAYQSVLSLAPDGRRYQRFWGYVQGQSRQVWMEWFNSTGDSLLRVEYGADGQAKIAHGSIEEVRSVNPDYISTVTEEQIVSRLTDEPFDTFEGIDLPQMLSSLRTGAASDQKFINEGI